MTNFFQMFDPRRMFMSKGGGAGAVTEAAMKGGDPTSVHKIQHLLSNHRLADILCYESYDENTRLYHNADSVGIVLEVPPMTGAGEQTVKAIGGLFSQNLPPYIGLQFTLLGSSNIMPRLSRWAGSRLPDHIEGEDVNEYGHAHRHKGIFRTLARSRVEFLQQGAKESLFANQPYLIRDFRSFISITFPWHDDPSAVKRIFNIRDSVKSTLTAADLPSRELAPTELINVLDEMLNPSQQVHREHLEWDEGRLIRDQVTSKEKISLVDHDNLVINDTEVRSYSVRARPTQWAMWGMANLIGDAFQGALRMPCPFMVTFGVQIPDQEKLQSTAAIKQARATQNAGSVMARFMPIMHDQKRDWDFVQKELHTGGSLVKGYHQLVIFPKLGEGALAEQTVKSLFRSHNWTLQNNKYTQVPSFISALPMTLSKDMAYDLDRLGFLSTMTTNTAANMLPVIGEWKGTGTPNLMLFGRRGQIQFIDLFDNKQGNYNLAVAAASGAGKSFLTQELIVSMLGRGGRVFVIDVGRSYLRTCNILNGEFIEFSPETNININPFSQISEVDKDGNTSDEPFNEALNILKPLIAQMAVTKRDTDDLENALIEDAIRYAWDNARSKATVTMVADFLLHNEDPRARDLGKMLFPYTKNGSYARFFEGTANLDFNNPFIVLELDDLKTKQDLQSVVLMILMFQVTQTMYLGDRKTPTLCIIDEAWSLLAGGNKEAAKFIENGYRTARKYKGAFCCVTQGINDFYKSPAATAALTNSDWTFLLRQKPESIEDMINSNRMVMDPYVTKLMKSITTVQGEFSEMLVKSPTGYSCGRLVVDPFSDVLYSTQADEYARVKELQSQGLSLVEAMQTLVKERQAAKMARAV